MKCHHCWLPSVTPAALLHAQQKTNVKEKLRHLGLSQAVSGRILEDVHAKGTGRISTAKGKEKFDRSVRVVMEDWHRLVSSERKEPEFVEYLWT